MLSVREVRKSFGGVHALKGVTLEAERAEVHALVGANGAGKSTLMHILSGALTPDSGEVRVGGRAVSFAGPLEARKAGMSTVFQELSLVPQLSVARNLYLGREPRTRLGFVDRPRLARDARALLDRYGFDIDSEARVEALSVAQQQLVEIGRALSVEASILILDEPTAALSLAEQQQLFKIVAELKARELLILFVSHRLDEIFGVTDRVTVLRNGESVATHRTAEITELELVRDMIGHGLRGRSELPPAPATEATPALEASYHRNGHDSRFALHPGEIVGLAGFVGAGRSRLARSLIGLEEQTNLELRIGGAALKPRRPEDALRAGVVYLTEDRKRAGLFSQLSITKNTTAASLDDFSRVGFLAPAREKVAASRILAQLRLVAASQEMPVARLSGGNQQKVVLARGLMREPRVLICDEPTRGVDVGAKEELQEILAGLAQRGVAILMISSELRELLAATHRVLIMRDHRIVAERDSASVGEDSVLVLASGGAEPIAKETQL